MSEVLDLLLGGGVLYNAVNVNDLKKKLQSLQSKHDQDVASLTQQLAGMNSDLLGKLQSLQDKHNQDVNSLIQQLSNVDSDLLSRIQGLATASYIVFKDTDGLTKVKDGMTGQVVYASSDDASAIQYAVNQLRSGGRMLIKSGTYIVDTIYIQGVRGLSIVGEGWGTRLVAKGSDTIVFKIGDRVDSSKSSQGVEIAYLMIDGSNQATEDTYPENVDRRFGIEAVSPDGSTKDIYIHHLYIYNTGSDSIYMWTCEGCIVAYNLVENTRGYWSSIHEHGTLNADYPGFSHRAVIVGNVIRNSAVCSIRHGRIIAFNRVVNSGGREYTSWAASAIVGGDPGSLIYGNVIEGTQRGVSGILTWRSGNIIEANTIVNASKHGIIVGYNIPSITPVSGHTIVDNVIINPGYNGIFIPGSVSNSIVKGNTVVRPAVSGILFGTDAGNDNVVEGNVVIDPAYPYNGYNGYGIVVYGSYQLIKNNKIIVASSNVVPQAFIKEGGGDYNVIEGNYIPANASTREGPIVKTGAHTVVRDNPGYLTENSGTAVIPAGSTRVTVNHGLASAPTKILVTPYGNARVWVENITSTSFDIVTDTAPSSNLSIAWYAEV